MESTARRGAWWLFVAAVLVAAYALFLQRHFFHDDAFITLRYVERWLAGKGLTWNDGERVEGFSSPAWLAQIALLSLSGIGPPLAARILGLAYALAIVVLWYRAKVEPAGLLVMVTIPGFALWTWGGLETQSFCFWILFALVLIRRMPFELLSLGQVLLLAFAIAAMTLTRPEGIAVAAACLGAAWPQRRQRAFAIPAFFLAVVVASYEAFRITYFGDYIATSVRAKALGLPIGERLENAAIYVGKTTPQWIAGVLLSLWLLLTSAKRKGIPWLLLPLFPLVLVVFVAGGDHMPGSRFMLAPVAVLCLAASLAPPSPRRLIRRMTLGLAVAAALWQLTITSRNPTGPNPAAAVGEIVGRTLAATFTRGTLIATATAGSVPYFAPSLSFIDTLGLNDRHIASTRPAALSPSLLPPESVTDVPGHRRGDGAYVLSRRPDVVMLGGANGDLRPWFVSDYQLLLDPKFRATYAPWRLLVVVPESSRPWVADELDAASKKLPITLYVRRDSPAWAALTASDATPLNPPWRTSTTGH